MKKATTSFVCQECGFATTSWMGKCPECGVWNSLKEFRITNQEVGSKGIKSTISSTRKPQTLQEITYDTTTRMNTGFSEMDGVLGGGVVLGAVMLLAGDPGVGKSTLLLQTAFNIANGKDTKILRNKDIKKQKGSDDTISQYPNISVSGQKVLYISGEESAQQIKLRAERLFPNVQSDNLLLLSLTNTDSVVTAIEEQTPSFVIVDSIQTMESEGLTGLSGSVGQVRYAAFEIIKVAKRLNIPVVIVGHVTKEGMVAGPMVLSHMVDVVLFLEGEKNTGIKILRSLKNRFGPVDEVGIFTMEGEGMKEMSGAETLFTDTTNQNTPGSVLTVTMEGTRAFLVEIQALVVSSKLPLPRRVASGIDPKRLELLLAVLQKNCNLPLGTMDVFVNVAGGLKLQDRAADLAVCLALVSSHKGVALPRTVGIAEVGLLGELRSVPLLEKRVKEAQKLGFSNVLTAKIHQKLRDVVKLVGK